MRPFFFFVIFIVGYVVLAAEILSIRLIMPYAGGGTAIISIVIASVLLPLSVGAYFASRVSFLVMSVRRRLQYNFATSFIFLSLGLSFIVVETFFFVLAKLAFGHVINTLFYSLIFLVYPMFLLGQTVSLVSPLFKGVSLPYIASRLLFYGTLGSFFGGLFSSLVLMPYLGTHYATLFTLGLLFLIYALLCRVYIWSEYKKVFYALLLLVVLNNGFLIRLGGVLSNNQYNMIRVVQQSNGTRVLSINGNTSTFYNDEKGVTASNIIFINKTFIEPLTKDTSKIYDILIVGAGGFTMAIDDERNNVSYVDIDKSLKEISEKYFLKKEISQNKTFIVMPIRRFLKENTRKYDLIVLDTYRGGFEIPEHLITVEYFQQVRNSLKIGGKMVLNSVACPNFNDDFSRHLDNTLRAGFGYVSRMAPGDISKVWGDGISQYNICIRNVIYEYDKRG